MSDKKKGITIPTAMVHFSLPVEQAMMLTSILEVTKWDHDREAIMRLLRHELARGVDELKARH